MKPFLRPTDRARLAPVGWISEDAGRWAGHDVEVVYDPRQHQVVLFRGDPGDRTRVDLAEAGYRRHATDGTQEMWVRRVDSLAPERAGRGAEVAPLRPNVDLGARGL